jgi:hypothetical protein
MKKTFTFLAAVVLMTTAAVAQNHGNHQRDNNYGDDQYGNNYPQDVVINGNHARRGDYDDRERGYNFSNRERDMQIAEINRVYYHRIQSVKNRFFMGRYQKERMITALQFQREDEIRSVLQRFNHWDNHDDHRDNEYNDHDRRNW